jgi:hypothetical protein
MIRKPRDLPPKVARAFVEDTRKYFDEENRRAAASLPSESTRVRKRKSYGFPT